MIPRVVVSENGKKPKTNLKKPENNKGETRIREEVGKLSMSRAEKRKISFKRGGPPSELKYNFINR